MGKYGKIDYKKLERRLLHEDKKFLQLKISSLKRKNIFFSIVIFS
jgi:hypothetical protein